MAIDLTTASVRPSGTSGIASRTAAGFVVLTSADGAELVDFIDANQYRTDLISGLAERVQQLGPEAIAMIFTAGGEPYLLAWGNSTASVTSASARFTVAPVAGQVLIHPLGVDATGSVRLSNGPQAGDDEAGPVSLSSGTMPADAVSVDLAAVSAADSAMPDTAPEPETTLHLAESADTPPAAPVEVPTPPAEPAPVDPAPAAAEPEPAPIAAAPVAAAPIAPDVPTVDATAAPVPAESAPEPEPEPKAPVLDLPSSPNDLPTVVTAEAVEETERIGWGQPAAAAIVFADDAPPDRLGSDVVPPPMPHDAPAPQVPPAFRRAEAEGAAIAATVGPAPAMAQPPSPTGTLGPTMVLGVVCPVGHHNHPSATFCSTCGASIGVHQTAVLVNGPRPPLGILVVDDGSTVAIERDLIIGRDPAAHPDVRGGQAGALVLADDTLAMSRRHARLTLDEWSVVLSDLDSSNGTWLNRGHNPQEWMRVEPGTSVLIEPGDRLRIGSRLVQIDLHHAA